MKGTQRVLAEFRRPFQRLLEPAETDEDDQTRQQRAVARSLVADFQRCPPDDWIARFEREKAEREDAGQPWTDEEQYAADPRIFWMGSAPGTGHDRERPRHRVRLKPFELQATTVTRGQYRLFDPRFEHSDEQASWGGELAKYIQRFSGGDEHSPADDFPILMTDWFDAYAFTKYLGAEFRLPTEAEWEFACRAGRDAEQDAFHFGEALRHEQANFESKVRHTTPRGRYPLNAFQLDQMHGNVWEWCWDWYAATYATLLAASGDVSEPAESASGPALGSSRVLRGGSFYDRSDDCRSADRDRSGPVYRDDGIGFRLLREL